MVLLSSALLSVVLRISSMEWPSSFKEDQLRFSKLNQVVILLARLSLRVANGEEAWAEFGLPSAEEAVWSSA